MNATQNKIVWIVSQDGGKTVSGGYAGKKAKAKAEKESGGTSKRMTYGEFKKLHPYLDVVFFDD